MSKPRLHYLDWLRVAATLTIIFFHFNVILHDGAVSKGLPISDTALLPTTMFGVNSGAVAVSVFFILSGASLMYVYGDAQRLDLKTFFTKRFLDIFPLYYVAYFSVVVFYFVINKDWCAGIPAWKFLLTIIGMDGYSGVFGAPFLPNFYLVGEWFVGCILVLYLVFPLLLRGIRAMPKITAGIIAATAVIGYLAARTLWPDLDPSWFATSRLVDLAFGMYFIHFCKEPSAKMALGSAAVLALLSFTNIIPLQLNMTCAGIACFLLFGWLAAKAHNATANKAVSWLSGFSFTAFLLQHVVIIWVVDNVSYANVTLKTEALMLFVVFALILLWGLAVNWCGKRLKRWLRSRLLPAPTPKSAAPAPEQAA